MPFLSPTLNRHINKSPLRRGHLDLKLEIQLVSILERQEVWLLSDYAVFPEFWIRFLSM